MRKLGVLIAAVALVASLPATSLAGQDSKWVRGTIAALTASSVTVKVRGMDMTFIVDSKTDVTARGAGTATREAQRAGKAGPSFAELVKQGVLKTGQGLEVRYREEGGKMVASDIRALASPNAGETSEEAPKKPATMTAAGTVSAVTGNSLTVKVKEGELTFAVDTKTRVTGPGLGTQSRELKSEGKATTLGEFVKAGDSVTVSYEEAAGAKRAIGILVTRKGT